MKVLGFDTSTAATAVCVSEHGQALAERWPEPDELSGPPGHARELMPAVAAVMEEAGLGFPELDAIAVGVGPGTFTGLRIGVASARALAGSAQLELRPVSSLAALAAGAGADPALSLIDAKRGEVFAALFEAGEPSWGPLAAAPEEVAARVREMGTSPLAVGDGSVRFRGVLEAAGIRALPEGSRAHVVRALHVCRLAATAPPKAPEAVLPEYIRTPDAKPR